MKLLLFILLFGLVNVVRAQSFDSTTSGDSVAKNDLSRVADSKLKQWSVELSDPNFHVRQYATDRLTHAGRAAVDAISAAMIEGDLETILRGSEILEEIAMAHSPGDDNGAYQRLMSLATDAVGVVADRSGDAISEINAYRSSIAIERLTTSGAFYGVAELTMKLNGATLPILLLDDQFEPTDATFAWMPWVRGIGNVAVQGPAIRKDVLAGVAAMPDLRNLWLMDGSASGDDLSELRAAKRLQNLEIHYVGLRDVSAAGMAELAVRESMMIDGCGLPAEFGDQIQGLMPGLDVQYKRGGFLGVECLPGKPCLISRVSPDSGAQKAGLQPGDIITRVNQTEIKEFNDLRDAISRYEVDDTVEVEFKRADLQLITDMTLGRHEKISITPLRR